MKNNQKQKKGSVKIMDNISYAMVAVCGAVVMVSANWLRGKIKHPCPTCGARFAYDRDKEVTRSRNTELGIVLDSTIGGRCFSKYCCTNGRHRLRGRT